MKPISISDLITRLQSIKSQHGDLPIYINVHGIRAIRDAYYDHTPEAEFDPHAVFLSEIFISDRDA